VASCLPTGPAIVKLIRLWTKTNKDHHGPAQLSRNGQVWFSSGLFPTFGIAWALSRPLATWLPLWVVQWGSERWDLNMVGSMAVGPMLSTPWLSNHCIF
jgi:hypothetical protein